MTINKKAKDLVASMWVSNRMTFKDCQLCAMILCENMLRYATDEDTYHKIGKQYISLFDYWTKVKNEIDRL